MITLASHNVNGIRAAHKRGWAEYRESAPIDIFCLQEVRCLPAQLPEGVFGDYHVAWDPGELKGRNGVAIIARQEPAAVRVGLPGADEFANEGRYIEADFDTPAGLLTVASLYLPKGDVPDVDKDKYDRKFRFLGHLQAYLETKAKETAQANGHFVILGDFNIARCELDIKNWKGNVNNEGFLPEERAWFAGMLEATGLHDVVREHHGDEPGPYSWWSWRGQAFANDSGWRIDYHLATDALAARARDARVYREPSRDERLSDHSPVIVSYDLDAER